MKAPRKRTAKTSCIELKLSFSQDALFAIEIMRIKMGAERKEDAVALAFREFVESHGFAFGTDAIPQALLEEFGFVASGNVTTLDSKRGIMSVFLPAPTDRQWFDVIKRTTGIDSFDELVRLALSGAYEKYR
jgi:hypothetical protein